MSETFGHRRPPGAKKRRKAKDRHFMDAALDAYIRNQALLLWRDFAIYREQRDRPVADAMREAGFFGDRGAYQPIWDDHWRRIVLPSAGAEEAELFRCVEEAVRGAVLAEHAARQEQGDAPFEDTEDYQAFVRRAMEHLMKESSVDGAG